MDEDYLLSTAFFVFFHGLLEHIELVMKYVCSIHACRRFEHLVGMEVYHERAVILAAYLLGLVGHYGLLLVHLLFQPA